MYIYNSFPSYGTSTPTRLWASLQVNAVAFIKAYAIVLKTCYNTTYIGVIDLDVNERQTTIVGLEELDLSEWMKLFITQLVTLAEKNRQNDSKSVAETNCLDDFLAKSVADLASKLNRPACAASPKTIPSSFGDLLLFWSYCLHRCVCLCVCVFGLLEASTLYSFRGEPASKSEARWKLYFQVRCPVYYIYIPADKHTPHPMHRLCPKSSWIIATKNCCRTYSALRRC